MPGSTARAQIVEALGLDPDWNDADEYSFAELIEQVRKAGEAARLRDGLIEALILDESASNNDVIRQVLQIARERNEYADMIDAQPVEPPTQLSAREIDQLVRERDTFRRALDGALTPIVKRARKLRDKDIVQTANGRTWTVRNIRPDAFGVTVDFVSHETGDVIGDRRLDHPDEPVTVLVPTVERDGLLVLRKELGAQLVDYEPDADDEPEEAS